MAAVFARGVDGPDHGQTALFLLRLDTCVGERNHRAFILGLAGLVVSLLYGSNLTLTTVCRPRTLWGTVLVPESCSEVYEDIQ